MSYAARATRFSVFVEDVAIQCLGIVSFGRGGAFGQEKKVDSDFGASVLQSLQFSLLLSLRVHLEFCLLLLQQRHGRPKSLYRRRRRVVVLCIHNATLQTTNPQTTKQEPT